MLLRELTDYLDDTLKLAEFAGDASNNGLQIEGKAEVNRVLFGVDGCLALFERAAAGNFDFVFVHHGISWGGEPRRFTGMHAARFRTMFGGGISLYGVHLPLDAHPELGNNARLAALSELTGLEPFCNYHGYDIGFLGHTRKLVKAAELAVELETKLNTKAELIADHGRLLKTVAVVSGGGGMDALEQAAAAGADLLVTGELEHIMYHPAFELGIPVLALGHYATETLGPKAVMEHLRREFGIVCEFADLPTGL